MCVCVFVLNKSITLLQKGCGGGGGGGEQILHLRKKKEKHIVKSVEKLQNVHHTGLKVLNLPLLQWVDC